MILIFTDGTEVKLDSVKFRERAFNCIIGFSGLRFQVVLPSATSDLPSIMKDMQTGHPREDTLLPKDKHEGTG